MNTESGTALPTSRRPARFRKFTQSGFDTQTDETKKAETKKPILLTWKPSLRGSKSLIGTHASATRSSAVATCRKRVKIGIGHTS